MSAKSRNKIFSPCNKNGAMTNSLIQRRTLVAFAFLALAGNVVADTVPWTSDLAKAKEISRKTGKPVLIEFFVPV